MYKISAINLTQFNFFSYNHKPKLTKTWWLCVCEIMTALDKPQPTVSHHLNILKNASLLKWRKEGVWIHYKLSNPKLPESLNEVIKNP